MLKNKAAGHSNFELKQNETAKSQNLLIDCPVILEEESKRRPSKYNSVLTHDADILSQLSSTKQEAPQNLISFYTQHSTSPRKQTKKQLNS